MSRCIRNTFLVFGTASFLATALGILLCLHLAHIDEPAKHDVSRCSLCQQLLISKKEYTAETEPAVLEIDAAGHLIHIYLVPFVQQASLYQCHPRAPPA